MWTILRLLLTTTTRPCSTPPGRLRPVACHYPLALSLAPGRRTVSDRPTAMSSQDRTEPTATAAGGQTKLTSAPETTRGTPRRKEAPADRVTLKQEGRNRGGQPKLPLGSPPSRNSPKKKLQNERKASTVSVTNSSVLNSPKQKAQNERKFLAKSVPQINPKSAGNEQRPSAAAFVNQSPWNSPKRKTQDKGISSVKSQVKSTLRSSPKQKTQDERTPSVVSLTSSSLKTSPNPRSPNEKKPAQRNNLKWKRPLSESSGGGEMSSGASQRLAAAEGDVQATSAGTQLLAAIARAGNGAGDQQGVSRVHRTLNDQRVLPPNNQRVSSPNSQHVSSPNQGENTPQRKSQPQVSGEEMLQKVRVWEPVVGYREPGQDIMHGTGHEFTVVSYNVLSQHLYNQHPQLYEGTTPEGAAWEVRGPRLWAQLVSLQPDIVCLQEVEERDIETFWRPRCHQAGFNIVFKKRTGNDKFDGCAILYRESAFSLGELATVEYMQPDCVALDRDNVGVVVRLSGAGGDLVVACTHLLYNPRRHDVKLAQVALLLAELDRLAWCGQQQTYLPLLLTGDLNLEPFSPVYQFLCRGWLQYGGLSRRHLTPFGGGEQLLSPLLPPELGVSAFCRHAAVQLRRLHRPMESERERRRAERHLLAVRHSERHHPPPPLPLRQMAEEAAACYLAHGLRLRSVYQHGARKGKEVTTRQGQWVTVDYIFQSVSPPPGSVGLELTSRLALPTAAVCERLQPYPSAALPSDHLPLAARFRLVPVGAQWPQHHS